MNRIDVFAREIVCLACMLMYTDVVANSWRDASGTTWSFTVSGGKAYLGGDYADEWPGSAIPPSTSGSLDIPSTLDGYPVVGMNDGAFENCGISAVTIPEGVTKISRAAFVGCRNLRSVTMPQGVTKIEEYAFRDCSALSAIDIPLTVKEIGACAFLYCRALAKIKIPEGVLFIGNDAFRDTGLKTLDLGNNVCSVGADAFWGCEIETLTYGGSGRVAHWLQGNVGPTTVIIPEGVEEVSPCVFEGCERLMTVKFPSTLKRIDYHAFGGCSSLQSVTFPDGLEEIGSDAFDCCRNLVSVALPTSLETVRPGAFVNCDKLASVKLPVTALPLYRAFPSSVESVDVVGDATEIPERAFGCCYKLKEVTLPSSVKRIGTRAFFGCDLRGIALPSGVEYIGSEAFASSGVHGESLTSLVIPDGVKVVEPDAFRRSNIGQVELPLSALPFKRAFGDTHVERVVVSGGGDRLAKGDFEEVNVDEVDIRDSVSKIDSGAFSNCGSLASVKIWNPDVQIAEKAFVGCEGIRKVELAACTTALYKIFPDAYADITSFAYLSQPSEICDGMFRGCEGLRSAPIPTSVKRIGVSAFECCSGISTLDVTRNVECIARRAFYGCTGLCRVNVAAEKLSVEPEAFANCSRLISYYSTCAMDFIPDGMFSGCRMLQSCSMPYGIREIKAESFMGCSSLVSLTIPSSVASIGSRAFECCSGLISLVLPRWLREIGGDAFSGCTGIRSIEIPEYVTVGEFAFAYCSSLTDVTFKGDSTRVGDDAFRETPYLSAFSDGPVVIGGTLYRMNGDSLTQFEVPAGVVSICGRAFSVCKSLSRIDFPGMPPENVAKAGLSLEVELVYESEFEAAWQPIVEAAGFTNAHARRVGGCGLAPAEVRDWVEVRLASRFAKNGEGEEGYVSRFVEKFGTDYSTVIGAETGKVASDGSRLTVWDDYVAGTDPTNAEDIFRAVISVVDGVVRVKHVPELDEREASRRVYRTWGKHDLSNPDWTEVLDGAGSEFRFFKVSVEMR